MGLRERKKAETRRAIQEHALRLCLAGSFETTTVADIAAAAGVSQMTVFRHFPTKEDVILTDDYDPLVLRLLAGRPTTESPVERVRAALVAGLATVTPAERDLLLERSRLILRTPALRARALEQLVGTQDALATGLSASGTPDLRARAVAAGCLAAAATAVAAWVACDGTRDLAALVDEALAALREDL